MFRTRPPWFAIVCVSLSLLQLVLLFVAFYGIGPVGVIGQQVWKLAALGVSVGLGGLLLAQLPRALQWRPRRKARASAEMMQERRRIARDLHDNLGAPLVYAMALLEAQPPAVRELRSLLEQCMLELRLAVDSMDGADHPLADRLARLRHRIQPVLDRRGIHMIWDVDVPRYSGGPHVDHAAHIVAVVQEALSNVLQHSGATEVGVGCRHCTEEGVWCIEVTDNGCGIPPLTDKANSYGGHGMAGMHERARLAGGNLLVRPRQGAGTCIRLVLPCGEDASGAASL